MGNVLDTRGFTSQYLRTRARNAISPVPTHCGKCQRCPSPLLKRNTNASHGKAAKLLCLAAAIPGITNAVSGNTVADAARITDTKRNIDTPAWASLQLFDLSPKAADRRSCLYDAGVEPIDLPLQEIYATPPIQHITLSDIPKWEWVEPVGDVPTNTLGLSHIADVERLRTPWLQLCTDLDGIGLTPATMSAMAWLALLCHQLPPIAYVLYLDGAGVSLTCQARGPSYV